jgi:hypothetical protein
MVFLTLPYSIIILYTALSLADAWLRGAHRRLGLRVVRQVLALRPGFDTCQLRLLHRQLRRLEIVVQLARNVRVDRGGWRCRRLRRRLFGEKGKGGLCLRSSVHLLASVPLDVSGLVLACRRSYTSTR